MRIIFLCILFCQSVWALDNQRIFPLDNYTQNIDYWLTPTNPDYTKPLLSIEYQNERLDKLKHRYFGTNDSDPSPWSARHITSLIHELNSILKAETKFLTDFDNSKTGNQNKLGYALNKRPYAASWISGISKNVNLSQFARLDYNKNNRAIAVNNVLVRILPTDDPFYNSDKIPGEGYPFDNLQDSAIYTGTPLYITGQSVDGKWSLVISPDIAGWVHTDAIASVDDKFIATWQSAAYKMLAGITQNDIGIKDNSGKYLFSAYVGTILPLYMLNKTDIKVLVPVKNQRQMAEMKSVKLLVTEGSVLPIPATVANFSKILGVMQQRIYGWGNLGMYNDCSSELKNIFALFGIYVQRNTKSIDNAGKMTDLSTMSATERQRYLAQSALPLLTFIHVKGHVMLYVGTYDKNYNGSNSKVKNAYPLIYEQVWGLRDTKQTYRSIIGQSVFFPLLESYTEDKNLATPLSYSMFRVIDLSSEPDKNYKPDLNELLY
ncbi:MAG TPA: SH3 domain-containing protein [Aquella sp.]|nr:SH3 domain-containing protein [Aquella sp.]